MKVKVSLKDNSSWIPNNIVYDDVDLLFIPTKELIKMYLQKQSNWNSLREWLEERIEHWENEEKKWIEQGFMKFGGEANNKIILKGLLDKMNELEGKDND